MSDNEYDTVKCKKCKLPVRLNIAWFDPYKNSYVHFNCLSKKRMAEITLQEKKV